MVLSDLGATLVKLLVPAKDGSVKDVVLGYDTPQEYIDQHLLFWNRHRTQRQPDCQRTFYDQWKDLSAGHQ